MADFSSASGGDAYSAAAIAEADAFIASPHVLLIDGEWRQATSGETFDIIDPATGDVIARAAAGCEQDVDAAVVAATRAFESREWRTTDPHVRGAMLYRVADLMEQHAEELAVIQSRDLGCGPGLSRALVVGGIEAFRYYAGWPDKLCGRTMPGDGSSLTYTVREPLGVVGAIIPWNGPAQAMAWKVAAALACGNTVVFKAASEAPLVCLRIADLMREAGVPAGALNLLTGSGSIVGQAMAEHPGIAKITFTGSTAVGKGILEASVPTLKKVTLEMGGKSPTVIFADADLEKAVPAATTAFVAGAGQGCVCGTRIVVEDAVHDKVVERVVALVAKMKPGSAFDAASGIPPIVSKKQFDVIVDYIKTGSAEGARLVAGGNSRDNAGYFIEATVFDDVDNAMTIAQEEIFGPVVSIIRFSDEAEALRIANASQYGLSASVWTRDADRLHRMIAGLQAGTVWANTVLEIDTKAPFGGYKQSGLGRELGPESIDAFTQVKTGVIRYAAA